MLIAHQVQACLFSVSLTLQIHSWWENRCCLIEQAAFVFQEYVADGWAGLIILRFLLVRSLSIVSLPFPFCFHLPMVQLFHCTYFRVKPKAPDGD